MKTKASLGSLATLCLASSAGAAVVVTQQTFQQPQASGAYAVSNSDLINGLSPSSTDFDSANSGYPVNPLFPALRSGQRLFQGPPVKSKFLALVGVAAVGALASLAHAATLGFNQTLTSGNTTLQVFSPIMTASGPTGAWGLATGTTDFKLAGPNSPSTIDNGARVTMSFDARFRNVDLTNFSQPFSMIIGFQDAGGQKQGVSLRWFEAADTINNGLWNRYSVDFLVSTTRSGAGSNEFRTTDWRLWGLGQNNPYTVEIDNYSLISTTGGQHFAGMNTSFDNGDPSAASTLGQTITQFSRNNASIQTFVVAIPEPTTLALLLGLVGPMLLIRRRRA